MAEISSIPVTSMVVVCVVVVKAHGRNPAVLRYSSPSITCTRLQAASADNAAHNDMLSDEVDNQCVAQWIV